MIDNRRIVWMRAEGHRLKQICRAVGCVRPPPAVTLDGGAADHRQPG